MKAKCVECKKRKEIVAGKDVCWKCHIGSVGFGGVPGGARSSSGVPVEGDQFKYLG